jgi:HSP20 family protein
MTFAITRPRRSFFPVIDEMDKMLGRWIRSDRDWDSTADFLPPVDIIEGKDSLIVKAEVPGLEKNSFKVSVEDNVLTISGEKKMEYEEKDKEQSYHRVERTYGCFSRSFTLPRTVDVKNVKANYKNGILEVKIPKSEEAKPKEIEINVG